MSRKPVYSLSHLKRNSCCLQQASRVATLNGTVRVSDVSCQKSLGQLSSKSEHLPHESRLSLFSNFDFGKMWVADYVTDLW